jgi:hypothetical protein
MNQLLVPTTGGKLRLIGKSAKITTDETRLSPLPSPKKHPYHMFNDVWQNNEKTAMTVADCGHELDPSVVIHTDHGSARGVRLRAEPMPVGKIIDTLGLQSIIPESGELDVQMVGLLVDEHVKQIDYQRPGTGRLSPHGFSSAKALCENQHLIPDNPWVKRLKFLFPKTIVFRQELGVCVPMVECVDQHSWVLTFCDIHSQVVPGIHMVIEKFH